MPRLKSFLMGRLSGLADSVDKRIYVHGKKEDIRRALIHEFGHYLDYKCGISSLDLDFENIYAAEKYGFAEKRKTDDHATSNSQEYFAEAFAQLILYPELLAEKCPDTYDYFFYDLTQNTRDFSREMNAQKKLTSDMGYKPASEIKCLSCTMLHWSIVTHA